MKKLILLFVIITLSSVILAQPTSPLLRSTVAPKEEMLLERAPTISSTVMTNEKPTTKHSTIKGRTVSYIPIGQAGNAYGLYGNSRTYLWADPNLNSVVFTHRMTGGVELEGNSRIAYDVSIDGGTTWETNTKVYQPLVWPPYVMSDGRFPQGAILNPVGNTDPENAFYTYFIPVLDGSNGDWGGYAYGSNPLTETDPPNPSQVNLTSGGDFWRLIPDAYTTTTLGDVWYVDGNYEGSDLTYKGNLTLGHGSIIAGELVIEESIIGFMEYGDDINDHKIAFSPDGMTGYIMIMTDWESNPAPFTNYHPVIIKTTDGGITWGEPAQVQLGGVEGIESIKYYWHDSLWTWPPWPHPPPRDERWYNMGYHADIVVDGQGNPHITGIITIASDDGWYPHEGTMATWHVYSNDGGTTWDATALYNNHFFDGQIGGLDMYNRPYAMSTYNGRFLFFSWLDTDMSGANENDNPDIFIVGYDSEEHSYGVVDNVTELGPYWHNAFYGTASQYVFSETQNTFACELPFVFTEYTVPGDPLSEMNFYYIDGYIYDEPVGYNENPNPIHFSVAQNFPNPAANNTSVLITTEIAGVINLKITNNLGKTVHYKSVKNSALAHTFNLDVSNLNSGIYFYTVEIGTRSVTKKMIVK